MKLGTLLAFAVLFIFNQKNEVRGMIEKKSEEAEDNSRLLWCLKEMKLFISESPSEQSKTIKIWHLQLCRLEMAPLLNKYY